MILRSRPPRRHLPKKPPTNVYQLKVTLLGAEPPVWRRVLVPGDISLGQLHTVIQKAIGWTDAHLHEFIVGGQRYGEPDSEEPDPGLRPDWKATLRKVAPAQGVRFEYVYDFGDGWMHDVLVESIAAHEKQLRYPVCLAGERQCPPEDCGGPPGYADFLKAIRNPKHPQHAEMLEWIGRAFDPEAFNLAAVNRKLRQLKGNTTGFESLLAKRQKL